MAMGATQLVLALDAFGFRFDPVIHSLSHQILRENPAHLGGAKQILAKRVMGVRWELYL